MRLDQNIYLRQRGFSLVELIVGLVIGLLSTLVIMQVFSAFEGQKRSTSGSADAQTNGSIALMNIQSHIQMAGYGLPLPMADKNNSSLKCNPFPSFDHDSDAATDDINLFPIVVEDGGANSDIITVRYSTTAMGAVPVTITNFIGADKLVVTNHIGCKAPIAAADPASIVLITSGNTCGMAKIKVAGVNPLTDPQAEITLAAAKPAFANAGSKIACMGNWQDYTYELKDNELLLNGKPIVSEVVSLQAQYGISATAGNNQVNQWVNASGATWKKSVTTPTVANRNRIKAVRIAIIVRNGLLEKTAVSKACTSNTGADPTGVCAWDATSATPGIASNAPLIDLDAIGGANYRYRVFETIVPLRNMLWSKEAV